MRRLQGAVILPCAVRILVVEDEKKVAKALRDGLEAEHYEVQVARTGEEGFFLVSHESFDLVVLDLMLPRRDGLEILTTLRRCGLQTPVLILKARDTVDDRVHGLDSGADDYLVKPFALSELLARLRALLRREAPSKEPTLAAGDLRLDPAMREVTRGGRRIELTARLFALLEYLLRHPNQILTREQIESHLWSYDFEATSNVVDVYIRRLRLRIDDPFAVKLLETVRGVGYRLRVPPAS
jgi:DNA-binding response OmpR family regulator